MGIIFGKKKQVSRISDQDKAVLVSEHCFQVRIDAMNFIFQQLKQQRDKLKQYQKRIEQTLDKDRELAKKLLRNGQKE